VGNGTLKEKGGSVGLAGGACTRGHRKWVERRVKGLAEDVFQHKEKRPQKTYRKLSAGKRLEKKTRGGREKTNKSNGGRLLGGTPTSFFDRRARAGGDKENLRLQIKRRA